MKSGRLEFLTDGIFAIVMTLLVLEIAVPVVHGPYLAQELMHELQALWPKLFSFITSFLILGIYWAGNQVIFNHISKLTFHFIWLNILFLLTVSFIPFSTALIGEYPLQSIAQFVYGTNLIVTGLLLYSIWRWGISLGLVERENLSGQLVHNARNKILLPPVIYFIGMLLGLWSPVLGVLGFILGPILYFVPVDSKVWRVITRAPSPSA